ncbi:DUF6245 family protein [Streptomyces goshikiensis]|uniref:DUF6245 family protein n=1 Tax=Streptomyces goshikiensis TaxID=1942 RepID=UPI003658A3E3
MRHSIRAKECGTAQWEEQLKVARSEPDDPARRVEFIRRQVLRAGTPLRLMA